MPFFVINPPFPPLFDSSTFLFSFFSIFVSPYTNPPTCYSFKLFKFIVHFRFVNFSTVSSLSYFLYSFLSTSLSACIRIRQQTFQFAILSSFGLWIPYFPTRQLFHFFLSPFIFIPSSLSFSPRITNLPISFLRLDYKSAIFPLLPTRQLSSLSFSFSLFRSRQTNDKSSNFQASLSSFESADFPFSSTREKLWRSRFHERNRWWKRRRGRMFEVKFPRDAPRLTIPIRDCPLSNRGGRVNPAAITNQPTLETSNGNTCCYACAGCSLAVTLVLN